MPDQVAIGGFEARFYNVKTPMGLVITEARVKGVNAVISTDPVKVEMLKPGEFEAFIDEKALTVFLDEQAPGGLRDFEIELKEGKLFVKASLVVIVPMRASAVCTLRIVDGKQVFVDVESVDVMGVGAKGLVEGHLSKVNPVLDVADLPLKVELSSIAVEDAKVVVKGTAKPS